MCDKIHFLRISVYLYKSVKRATDLGCSALYVKPLKKRPLFVLLFILTMISLSYKLSHSSSCSCINRLPTFPLFVFDGGAMFLLSSKSFCQLLIPSVFPFPLKAAPITINRYLHEPRLTRRSLCINKTVINN